MTVVRLDKVSSPSGRIDYDAIAEQVRKAMPVSTAPAQTAAPVEFDPSEIRPVAPASAAPSKSVAVDLTGFRVSYTIENTTNHDVTISPSAILMTQRSTDGALDSPRAPIGAPLTLFVPARQRVILHVQIPYLCVDREDLKGCLTQLLNEADGLVVIDKSQHLQVRLPKPYWNKSGTQSFMDKP
jgi:hypothetical protein